MSTHCLSVYATNGGDVILCPESPRTRNGWAGKPMRVLHKDYSNGPALLLIPEEFADEYLGDSSFEFSHSYEVLPRWVRTGEYVIHVDREGVG